MIPYSGQWNLIVFGPLTRSSNIQQATLTVSEQVVLSTASCQIRTVSWPVFKQVRLNIASVSLDHHMPHVVDVCFTAGHVIFAVAAYPLLIALVGQDTT